VPLLSVPVHLLATLLTDLPLDESRFRGLLMDVAQSVVAGNIQQDGYWASHLFGNAEWDAKEREIKVQCRKANTAHPAALGELQKQGFRPESALEFTCSTDREAQLDAWSLLGAYAEVVQGWAVTSYMDFDEAAGHLGHEEGLLHAPVGGRKKGVLIAANQLKNLCG